MTVLYNDPAEFAEDQLAGFADLYADRLRVVPGGVVGHRGPTPIVAVVVGGGSGHYPAFAGLVGPGLASGAVVGNIFTSPSAAQVYSVAKAADQGLGVVLSFGNYAGDIMNFGIAAERLRREGIDARIVVVTDDIASSPVEQERRGIAGDFVIFKALGAAAAEGADIAGVERAGRAANAATRTLGVAFSGCFMPGAREPLFTLPVEHMGVGLGIHGEPGIRDAPLLPARELARLLVDGILAERPETPATRVAAILNGLGSTKHEELFLLWNEIRPLLDEAGLTPVEPEVGELVTSLDMGGCSLTLSWLDEELEGLWHADAYAPGYRKSAAPTANLSPAVFGVSAAEHESAPTPSPAGAALAALLRRGAAELQRVLHENEAHLGRIDAVAGDGDHGRGMAKGIDAAAAAIEPLDGAGPGWTLRTAGRAWAAEAGGTSGVLWGAGLEAAGEALGDVRPVYDASAALDAVIAFADAIRDLGRAEAGDKTMVDALLPFRQSLSAQVAAGRSAAESWRDAAVLASEAARATAALRPRKGRARPLAEKSVGTPDPGATSFAVIVDTIGALMSSSTRERSIR
ncbi:dihydroxyacetone kinase family protein [Microbacterium ulmi]|uniref:Dihydroxyacetone kinase family protein n=1 Tax=Microbacterium ulmi TaxID=179095 RepID=A0A7Y2M1N9_9MICO|nr:dihydroxyacetone kinase family protein [Microbacterium ulmi]NII68281.1 dihydroxyacetone kinase [Microbacterium ulmi]NNH04875.1 dihydroxyacetone kinase family protein [Microbacterium ulmi]